MQTIPDLELYALPLCNLGPILNLQLAESMVIHKVDPYARRVIRSYDLSPDGSTIALEIDGFLNFFLVDGANNYEKNVNILLKSNKPKKSLPSLPFIRSYMEFTGKRAILLVPEKQTIQSLFDCFPSRFKNVFENELDNLEKEYGSCVISPKNYISQDISHLNISFQYDSHLTNLGSILLFEAVMNSWGLSIDTNIIRCLPRKFVPDLITKFMPITLHIPWVADMGSIDEYHFNPETKRGLMRIYRNPEAIIRDICVIIGDSHSYSGLAPIASHFFAEVRFYWGVPTTIQQEFRHQITNGASYILEEMSERFFYSHIISEE